VHYVLWYYQTQPYPCCFNREDMLTHPNDYTIDCTTDTSDKPENIYYCLLNCQETIKDPQSEWSGRHMYHNIYNELKNPTGISKVGDND
jgi:hypothetical protein